MCILRHILLGDHIKEDEMVKACSMHGRYGKVTKILVGKPKRKIPYGKARHRWKDNIMAL
jgi:hypothetical protein